MAFLSHRRGDIDGLAAKAIVYLVLVAFIGAVYVAVVVGGGMLVGTQGRPHLALSIAATAVVAVAFPAVRQRTQRLADRVVHGQRATPYEILSRFSEQMAGAIASREMLPQMARILVESASAARVEVWLRTGQRFALAACWPERESGTGPPQVLNDEDLLRHCGAAWTTIPVRHQGETLGALAVATSSGRPPHATEHKLLTDLAVQVGLILRNVRLAEDIRASSRRLVAAQDAERSRLEHDIGDRVERPLSALATALSCLRPLADGDEDTQTIAMLRSQTTATLSELRDLARGVYPALLADSGLIGALGAQASRSPVAVTFDPEPIRRHAHTTEAAVYFCCLEALQNVAKHAGARRAVVRLWDSDGRLQFSVWDDGVGFDPTRATSGWGLRNMADRVEALAGRLQIHSSCAAGTRIAGWLPAAPVEPGP